MKPGPSRGIESAARLRTGLICELPEPLLYLIKMSTPRLPPTPSREVDAQLGGQTKPTGAATGPVESKVSAHRLPTPGAAARSGWATVSERD